MNNTYARKDKRYSQTDRAVNQRNSRVCKMNERRFNNPLRAFIEHKYPTIFNEYTELYESMRAAHPHRKNLVRTSTFKQWLSTESTSATPSIIPQCGDIITQALQETFASDQQISLPVEQGPPQIYQQIDEILDEMMANEDMRNVLEQPNPTEDEGIELNLLDEIYEDIEPLDYALEVEPSEF